MKDTTVTSIVHHHIKEDKLDDFKDWIKRIQVKSAEFEGHIDSKLIDSCGKPNERISIFRFKNKELLDKWLNSNSHQKFLSELDKITTSKVDINSYTGMEHWFEETSLSPMRMSILTYIGLLPLVLIIPSLIDRYYQLSSFWLNSISTAIIVLLMTYLVMPVVLKAYIRLVR